MFLKGLMNGGVPIKFATWNNYKSTGASTSVNIQIQERGRSVKSIFAMQRRDTGTFASDGGASFFCTGTGGTSSLTATAGANTLQEFQFRIGGRYFIFNPGTFLPLQSRILLLSVVILVMVVVNRGLN